MRLIKNNAVLSSELKNTAATSESIGVNAMPAQHGKARHPISSTDFERHCAERFSNSSTNAAFAKQRPLTRPTLLDGVMEPFNTTAIPQELKDQRPWLNWSKARCDAGVGVWVSFPCAGSGL
ncbi:MAG: hypothetical protein WCG09_10365 [Halobacteriota archaeon]